MWRSSWKHGRFPRLSLNWCLSQNLLNWFLKDDRFSVPPARAATPPNLRPLVEQQTGVFGTCTTPSAQSSLFCSRFHSLSHRSVALSIVTVLLLFSVLGALTVWGGTPAFLASHTRTRLFVMDTVSALKSMSFHVSANTSPRRAPMATCNQIGTE